jgi:hypothetical protein
MPNVNRAISPFVNTGNPDTAVEIPGTVYAGGDLGTAFDYNNRTYQKVTVDPAAVAVLSNQLAFWSNRALYQVTNVSTAGNIGGVAGSFRNNVAGVFRGAVPAGSQCFILLRGPATVREAGAALPGMILVANTGTAADALGIAIGTGPGLQPLGVVTTATGGGVCTANMDIENIP